MEEASRRKDKDPTPQRPEPGRPLLQKTQREEEQGPSQLPPDPMQAVAEEDLAPDPMQWEEDQRGEEEQGSSQPAPAPSEQAEDQRFTESWITFPREDNPATWISDDYGEWRPRSASSLEPYYRDPDPEEEQGSSQPPAPSEQAKVLQFFSGSSVKLVSYVNVSAFTLEPYYRDPDPEEPEYLDDMADFYLEAARRLPIAQMPNLAGFLSSCGLLLGLNEPVTNIIVNAMHRMATFGASNNVLPQGTDPVRHAADRASYVAIARKSRAALVFFMTIYFRHLTQAQAKRYLRAARHDLALAVGLVELHRKGLVHGRLFDDLHPDCARTKTALRYAATAARLLHDPDDLMRLVASRDRLTNLLSSQHALSNADFEMISKLIATNKAPESTTCILHQPASMDAADFWVKAYVGKRLEEVLFNYASKYPLGPQYKLGIICGVASKICSPYQRGLRCYHANFLAMRSPLIQSVMLRSMMLLFVECKWNLETVSDKRQYSFCIGRF